MESNHETSDELLLDIPSLLYPNYPPGCTSDIFLQNLQPLMDAIFRFDLIVEELEDSDSAVLQVITHLNTCFSQCPRQELMTKVLEVIGKCKRGLKNLAVGRSRIKYSKWQAICKQNNPILSLYSINDPAIRHCTDLYYLKYRRIPHLELLLLNYPSLLISKQLLDDSLKAESQLPLHHHHYIALIAASTMGCRYMWLRATQQFLAAGGNQVWIKEGISATPPLIQTLGRISGKIAYSLNELMVSDYFEKCQSAKEKECLLEGIVILCYYQCFSCLSQVTGLASDEGDSEKYLTKIVLPLNHQKSFEIVRKYQRRQAQREQQVAQQLDDILNEQLQEQQVKVKENIPSNNSFSNRKPFSFHRIRKTSFQSVDQQELESQLQHLHSFQGVKKTFGKYSQLESFQSVFIPSGPLKQSDLVLSSEWEWDMQVLQGIESVLGTKVRASLEETVGRLKMLPLEQGKKISHYYQFSNNYIHQFINYNKLLQQLSPVEKQYIKLVTKSPFLFSELIYSKMYQELKKSNTQVMEFILHCLGSKLQLSISLATLLFDRSQQQ